MLRDLNRIFELADKFIAENPDCKVDFRDVCRIVATARPLRGRKPGTQNAVGDDDCAAFEVALPAMPARFTAAALYRAAYQVPPSEKVSAHQASKAGAFMRKRFGRGPAKTNGIYLFSKLHSAASAE